VSFKEILQEIVEGCGGGMGAALMGTDGMPIEQVGSDRESEVPLLEDISVAGVEFQRVLEEIHKASDGIEAGSMEETVLIFARISLVFRPVDEETFLVVAVAPDGNLGKARYLIRKNLYAIRQEL